ncbi:MAG: hypothetical protein KF833_19685 [Verrucomicrobiae bacterium]|nr:hypothetical protein [Verrucomicrobiae bacterium]
MSEPATIPAEGLTPILHVRALNEAMTYYTEKLLFERLWDWGDPPDFGAVRLGSVENFFSQGGPRGGETLEETLLHTFEPVNRGGVASPHTPGTLALMRDLKTKHGIDYDVHAN